MKIYHVKRPLRRVSNSVYDIEHFVCINETEMDARNMHPTPNDKEKWVIDKECLTVYELGNTLETTPRIVITSPINE